MCGICGWVAWETDLRTETSTLAAMTESMACRGPDDAGIWIDQDSGSVALGHRRLAVIDPEGGRQPMTITTPDGPIALVYSGETYNFQELRTELEGHGHRFRTRSDTEVVLRGWLCWGTDLPRRLRGMFALAIWDGRRRTLVMVRDRLAVKPLYYAPTGDGVLFGSEPKAIFANPQVRPRMGIGGLRELFAVVNTPGHGVWDGLHEVKPATIVTVDADGIAEHTYWRLETRAHDDDLATTIDTVRDLLEAIVAEQLVADVPLCTLLSGGLDSSMMTALAARLRAARGQTVRSFAVDYTGHDTYFTDQIVQKDIDAPFARMVASKAGTDHTDIVLDSAALADPALRDRVIVARDLPLVNGDVDTSLLLLFEQIAQHSTVALSGEAADELFGGYPQFFDPEVQHADGWPWIVHYRCQVDAELALLTPDFSRALDLPTYWADTYAAAIAPVERAEHESDLEYRMRKINYVHITCFTKGLLDRKDRISMAVGLEVRVPYCDHRLIEYVYNIPWAYKTYRGREKDVLRSAAQDLLPTPVLRRLKSGYPATPHPAYLDALRHQARVLTTDRQHPVFDLIRHDRLQAIATTPRDRLPIAARHSMHRALTLAQWIDLYRPTRTTAE